MALTRKKIHSRHSIESVFFGDLKTCLEDLTKLNNEYVLFKKNNHKKRGKKKKFADFIRNIVIVSIEHSQEEDCSLHPAPALPPKGALPDAPPEKRRPPVEEPPAEIKPEPRVSKDPPPQALQLEPAPAPAPVPPPIKLPQPCEMEKVAL